MAYKSDMQSIVEYEDLVYGLALSKIENIELGYLTDNRDGLCQPSVNSIIDYYSLMKDKNSSYSVMIHPIDGYDISRLPKSNGEISNIRLLMRRDSVPETIVMAESIKAKGYGIIVDLDEVYKYSDLELVKMCSVLNELNVETVVLLNRKAPV